MIEIIRSKKLRYFSALLVLANYCTDEPRISNQKKKAKTTEPISEKKQNDPHDMRLSNTEEVTQNDAQDTTQNNTQDTTQNNAQDTTQTHHTTLGDTSNCLAKTLETTVNDQQRTALLRPPQNLRSTTSLTIVLHGNGDSPENFCASTGVCQFLNTQGSIAVVPAARRRDVQAFNQTVPNISWDGYTPSVSQNEDLALIVSLIAKTRNLCPVNHVYIWGHSQGGYLSYLAGRVITPPVNGVLVSAASNPLGGFSFQQVQKSVRFFFLVGDRDPSYQPAKATSETMQSAGFTTKFQGVTGLGHGGFPSGYNQKILTFLSAE